MNDRHESFAMLWTVHKNVQLFALKSIQHRFEFLDALRILIPAMPSQVGYLKADDRK